MRAKGLWALSLPKQCAVCSLDGLCMPTCLSMFALSSQVSAAVLCTYLCTFIAQCWRDLVLATVKQPSLPATIPDAVAAGSGRPAWWSGSSSGRRHALQLSSSGRPALLLGGSLAGQPLQESHRQELVGSESAAGAARGQLEARVGAITERLLHMARHEAKRERRRGGLASCT